MKPTNFPGNMKKKRLKALENLKKNLSNGCKPKGNVEYVKQQIAILEEKLKSSV